jgi:hypothetical protein
VQFNAKILYSFVEEWIEMFEQSAAKPSEFFKIDKLIAYKNFIL